jgi:hypothetical protein
LEARQFVAAVERLAVAQHEFGPAPDDADRAGLRIDHPHFARAILPPHVQLFLDAGVAVVGRDDFDGDIRCAGIILRRHDTPRQAHESDIRAADQVRIRGQQEPGVAREDIAKFVLADKREQRTGDVHFDDSVFMAGECHFDHAPENQFPAALAHREQVVGGDDAHGVRGCAG